MNNQLIIFDGVCNLCNRTVDFIIKHDRKKQFRFAALQSEVGGKLIDKYNIPPDSDSVIFINNSQVFTESEAAIEIARLLPFPWKMAIVFKIIPEKVRNIIYRWIAKNRYLWFGKKENCRIPSSQEKKIFLKMNDLEF